MAEIVLSPITRIEGHARVVISLDSAGEVEAARVIIPSLRGFERFIVGRPLEEVPRIVTRICGVCPWAHHLAAAKACDAAFGLEIPAAAQKLRELSCVAHYIHSHILNFFVLSGPDLMAVGDSEPSHLGLLGILRQYPEVMQRALETRRRAQWITQIIGGRAIHPDSAVPGGWSKPLGNSDLVELRTAGYECLDFAAFAISFGKNEIFPRLLAQDMPGAGLATGFLGMVEDGALNLYDGRLRMMDQGGAYTEFSPEDYRQHIIEVTDEWSYAALTYGRRAPSAVENCEDKFVYRANSLARINVCDRIATPMAQDELMVLRNSFGRPAQPSPLFYWARLIEVVYAAERLIELLYDPEITEPNICVAAQPAAGHGVGVVEAPRGTLIHEYATDERGLVTAANIIVGTTHNSAAMNQAVYQIAKHALSAGFDDSELMGPIGQSIRAYDP
jgi:F420-non-reducing hydrogenase large subunit